MTALLSVRDLRVTFPVAGLIQRLLSGGPAMIEAVAGVSFDVAEGETFALVGESGSGKTTLARAIAGLVPAADGSVTFGGVPLLGLSHNEMKIHRRQMAMMFQDPVGSLSPRKTVGATLAEPFTVHGLGNHDLKAEAVELLRKVGLPADFAGRYPHQLSGGQARRVGVARALALSPKLIIADEPTAGLDVSVQGEVLNLLNELQQRLGLSMLIITHNLNVVRHVADRMAIMYLGRFVEVGPTDAIFHGATHPYSKALLSANPEPDPDARIDRLTLKGEIPSLLKRPEGCEFHTRCPFVKDRCRSEVPAAAGPDSHRFTCHFPLA